MRLSDGPARGSRRCRPPASPPPWWTAPWTAPGGGGRPRGGGRWLGWREDGEQASFWRRPEPEPEPE